MLMRLVQKEVLLHLRETRFFWVAGLCCALVLMGLVLMGLEYQKRVADYQTSLASEQRYLHSVNENSTVLQQVRELTNERGIYAFRRPQVLEPLAGGLTGKVPAQIHVLDRASWSRQASDAHYRNPLFVLFPRPDFVFVVGSILSLVALFFTFDSVCGEKQAGTLRVMFSMGVSRDRVLIGKWLGAMTTLAVPFLLATGFGLAVLGVVNGEPLTADIAVRLGMIVLVSLVYLSLFVTMGIAISVFTRRPSSSLLICLAAWIGVSILLPNLLASLGTMVDPIPTFQQIRLQKRGIDLERGEAFGRIQERLTKGEITEEQRLALRTAASEKAGEEKTRIDLEHRRQVERQTGVSISLSRLSPLASLTFSAMELADTGLSFYRNAYTGFEQYRKSFREYAANLKQAAAAEELKSDWLQDDEVPSLKFHASKFGQSLDAITTEFVILVVVQIVLFALTFVRFLKYDVR